MSLSVVLLTTPRLILRRFRDSDAETFASYRSDPAVARYQFWDTPIPVGAARAFVHEESTADPAQPGWFQYAIELCSDGGLVGDVGVNFRCLALLPFIGDASHIPRSGRTIRAVAGELARRTTALTRPPRRVRCGVL